MLYLIIILGRTARLRPKGGTSRASTASRATPAAPASIPSAGAAPYAPIWSLERADSSLPRSGTSSPPRTVSTPTALTTAASQAAPAAPAYSVTPATVPAAEATPEAPIRSLEQAGSSMQRPGTSSTHGAARTPAAQPTARNELPQSSPTLLGTQQGSGGAAGVSSRPQFGLDKPAPNAPVMMRANPAHHPAQLTNFLLKHDFNELSRAFSALPDDGSGRPVP